uniref:Uncharacterized protein LOC105650086 n=1 Tax=Rhizophora mucronata TaxID=61149 RepID=A0A2P2LJI5_RHIMU
MCRRKMRMMKHKLNPYFSLLTSSAFFGLPHNLRFHLEIPYLPLLLTLNVGLCD